MTFELIVVISFAGITALLAVIDFLQQSLISDLNKKIAEVEDHLLFHGKRFSEIETAVKTRMDTAIASIGGGYER